MPLVGFKIAKICLKKKIRRGEVLEAYEPEMFKPKQADCSKLEED